MEVKVEVPDNAKLDELGVKSWPIWEKEVSEFPWTYDATEIFYVIEGKAEVVTHDGETVSFGKGDLVTFPKSIKCTWKVTSPIKKHYKFI